MIRKIGRFVLTIAVFWSMVAVSSRAQSVMTRHVREVTRTGEAKLTGHLPGEQTMNLNIVLPLRDPAGLDAFLKEVYDPASPTYRRFLTVAQFTERFGPTEADYEAVVRFAKVHGYEVV